MYQQSFYVYSKKIKILNLHEVYGNIHVPNMEIDVIDCSHIFVDINKKRVTWTRLALIVR